MKKLLIVLLLVSALAVPAAAQRATRRSAQPAAPTDAEAGAQLRERVRQLLNAWSMLDPQNGARYYAKDADIVFFGPATVQYKGWDAYALGLKALFAHYQNLSLRLNDDAQVRFRGDVAYASATWNAAGELVDGTRHQFDLRWTAVLERRNQEWMVVHEHVSLPATLPAAKPAAEEKKEPPKQEVDYK